MNVLKELFNLQFAKTAVLEKDAAPKDSPANFRTPMVLADTFNHKYGDVWLDFLPETVRSSLKELGVDDESLVNKAMATQTALTNADLEKDWDMFEKVVLAFNDHIPDFTIIELPSMSELVWGYTAIKGLRSSYTFGDDIKSYIIGVMRESGLVWCPWIGLEAGDNAELIHKVKEYWNFPNKDVDDPDVGVQLDKLDIIKEYVKSWNQ